MKIGFDVFLTLIPNHPRMTSGKNANLRSNGRKTHFYLAMGQSSAKREKRLHFSFGLGFTQLANLTLASLTCCEGRKGAEHAGDARWIRLGFGIGLGYGLGSGLNLKSGQKGCHVTAHW